MKQLLFVSAAALLMGGCAVKEYFSGTSPHTCYGLGNPECVRQGYHPGEGIMQPGSTAYEQQQKP